VIIIIVNVMVMMVCCAYFQEAFDYIGSSRMAYDMRNMRKGKMNFTVDDIEMFIEIGQIGLHSTSNSAALWLHSGLSESKEVITVLCYLLFFMYVMK